MKAEVMAIAIEAALKAKNDRIVVLEGALRSAKKAIEDFKVPQTHNEVALLILKTVPLLNELERILEEGATP